ncbi:FliH/SctL family protein [Edaphobacter modestus]|uniref:Flagellar assembly protein FliH n=1 Tax=Edaphobacter modestus TaxID=388466 RepID=A0A4Q7YRX2_9BACT|nr:FliH/SctL family protein [Edaphobacter modestus]RZU39585.1 flagellar assembly protein FliH [Edaphobacter modestus]
MISPSEPVLEAVGGLRVVLPLEFEELKELSGNEPGEPVLERPIFESESGEEDALTELEARLSLQTENSQRQIDEVRQQTRVEVREELAEELEKKITQERESVARLCERFSRERTRYFAEVEAEVVRLALAIAGRVLHREIALDPLLLQGAVRVALEKVQENGSVRLHVPEGQKEKWGLILARAHHDDVVVEADRRLEPGECFLETSVGRVDLGVKAQLEEIEKGFFDLLQQRPA